MKTNLIFAALALSLSQAAFAADPATCSYKLDQKEYWEKADGYLVLNGKTFRCESIQIADDSFTLCKKAGNRSKNFDLIVGFDGAEAGFAVYKSMSVEAKAVCAGTAITK
jgi:hypothetical protein